MAAKKLVIVESPTKAKTLGKFLGADYEVMASMGHLRDLPKSKLGVDVENHFKPDYVPAKGKGDLIRKLKSLSKKADVVYLAMDPDREGEAIAWHTKELLEGKKGQKFSRVTFHEITKSAIAEAMEHPGVINHDLVDAQQARRVLDRLVGYSLSPVLWRKIRRGLSAGRVQSVALRLIVDREKEIAAFSKQEYWAIVVQLKGKEKFAVELFEAGGKPVVIKGQGRGYSLDSEKVVKPIVGDLKKASYVVESVEKKERRRKPYPPFTTSTLQQAGANVLGWSAKMTMSMAQQLYEAGLITYHRTDSVNLAQEAVVAARELIGREYGADFVPEKAIEYATKSKNAQEAHEAIRPTDVSRMSLAEEKNGFTERHEKLYKLIWRRFVACQMMAAVYDATTIIVAAQNSKYKLRASGSVVKFEGWRKAYGRAKVDEEVTLPELVVGEKPKYMDLTAEQKATEPPPRFNDASIIKELEKRGIGRPSTYAPTISTLIVRGYMERLERRFHPTSIGMTVVPFLQKHFADIMDYDFTAEMEEDLDRISRGEKEWEKVMAAFWKPFDTLVSRVEKDAKRVEIPVEKTGEKCPTCTEGEVVVRTGRFGKFLSCSRFPECKYTASYTETLEGAVCPECRGEVQIKRTRKGRMFYGCGNYPKCNWASWQDPRVETKKVAGERA